MGCRFIICGGLRSLFSFKLGCSKLDKLVGDEGVLSRGSLEKVLDNYGA